MPVKDRIDTFGAVALTGFAALLAFNQVVIAVVNEGLQPVFFAALRSVGGLFCLLVWMGVRAIPLSMAQGKLVPGLAMGVCFAVEFICLFVALDLTTVTRSAIIFYSMPLWLALIGHVLIPGERINPQKGMGLMLAFAGVVLALVLRGGDGGQGSLLGDLCAGGSDCLGGDRGIGQGIALAHGAARDAACLAIGCVHPDLGGRSLCLWAVLA